MGRVLLNVVVGTVLPVVALAQWKLPKNPGLPVEDLAPGVAGIVKVALGLVAVVALAFIVYGGFRYIVSRGDEREVETAKSTITTAVIGILVIGIAYAIVEFTVGAVFGQ